MCDLSINDNNHFFGGICVLLWFLGKHLNLMALLKFHYFKLQILPTYHLLTCRGPPAINRYFLNDLFKQSPLKRFQIVHICFFDNFGSITKALRSDRIVPE